MAHALTAYFRPCDFNATAIADYTAITDALVFSTEAFPVLGRTKQPFTEEAVFLRTKGSVVDGLRLGYLTVRPV
jgi:hypothetical protein